MTDHDERKLDDLQKQLHKTELQLTQYVTVVQRHLQTQGQVNARLTDLCDAQEERLRAVENATKVLDARVPEKLMGNDEIERRLGGISGHVKAIEGRVTTVESDLVKINSSVGKLAGIEANVNKLTLSIGRIKLKAAALIGAITVVCFVVQVLVQIGIAHFVH